MPQNMSTNVQQGVSSSAIPYISQPYITMVFHATRTCLPIVVFPEDVFMPSKKMENRDRKMSRSFQFSEK